MTLFELIGLNYSWAGRDWIIIQRLAEHDDCPAPFLISPVEAAMNYGEEVVLGFDGDTIYLK